MCEQFTLYLSKMFFSSTQITARFCYSSCCVYGFFYCPGVHYALYALWKGRGLHQCFTRRPQTVCASLLASEHVKGHGTANITTMVLLPAADVRLPAFIDSKFYAFGWLIMNYCMVIAVEQEMYFYYPSLPSLYTVCSLSCLVNK